MYPESEGTHVPRCSFENLIWALWTCSISGFLEEDEEEELIVGVRMYVQRYCAALKRASGQIEGAPTGRSV